MPSKKSDFLNYICQTSPHPVGLEIERALGATLYTTDGKSYLDFISGIGVANIGFTHPAVVEAVKAQVEKYTHVMVYGEYLQAPQVALAKKLISLLPDVFEQVYFTNSGTEANEGALKLAKKYTGRKKLISFENSFHGDSQGACAVTGREIYRKPFEPLLPGVSFLPFNDIPALDSITEDIAAVITEPIQGEGGMRVPDVDFLIKLRARCDETGALLIFDEVQTGFARTGKLFAMEHFDIAPDIVTLAKGMGGGMPLGGFAASKKIMATFSTNPPLSHVTTFGGHPVSCAAGLAGLEVILKENLTEKAETDGQYIQKKLRELAKQNIGIREIRGKGLMIGLEVTDPQIAERCVQGAFDCGVILGWTLHSDTVIRIMPPLILSREEIDRGLKAIAESLGGVLNK
ncbi:Gamma-aminobutyrate:alpha-ketoglutarate aminotransferase [hydrothermal vent metagenome]|uniref:Gamma-aminobutyrate:alpha-ketoglutarate aminotransferase n=1 Tax=hydrothermal vent metagenome TaxID=652676 RepID=A0A3B1DAA8_9ZZZZ